MAGSQKLRPFTVRSRYPAASRAADPLLALMRRDPRITSPAVRATGLPDVLELAGNVRAISAVSAASLAARAFSSALRRSGAATSPMPTELAVEAATRSGDRSEIVSAAEIARRLRVSRERVRQLAEEPGRFPTAVGNIRGSRAWRWGDVSDWVAAGGRRRPGRPRKAGSQ